MFAFGLGVIINMSDNNLPRAPKRGFGGGKQRWPSTLVSARLFIIVDWWTIFTWRLKCLI